MMRAVGAYIFAGGFTVGVEKSFEVMMHLEDGTYGVKTFKANRPHIPVHTSFDQWPFEALKVSRPDFVYCNPPCAVWSGASVRPGQTGGKDWTQDPRLSCHTKCFELVRQIQPTVFVSESVVSAFKKGQSFFSAFSNEAADLGYATTFLLINYADIGLPQLRKRFFFFLHKVALQMNRPVEEHKSAAIVLASVKAECDERLSRHAQFLSSIPPGASLAKYTTHIKCSRKFGFIYRRCPIDKPAPVVIGDVMVHPTEHRFLSRPEYAALSTYDPSWTWPISRTAAVSEMARGVPPIVGEWIGRQVRQSIEANLPVEPGLTTVFDWVSGAKKSDVLSLPLFEKAVNL